MTGTLIRPGTKVASRPRGEFSRGWLRFRRQPLAMGGLVFIAILLVGLAYVWKKGALQWD